MTKKACKRCNRITEKDVCPICNSDEMSKKWTGLIIITDPDNSKIAGKLGIKEKGEYALMVRK